MLYISYTNTNKSLLDPVPTQTMIGCWLPCHSHIAVNQAHKHTHNNNNRNIAPQGVEGSDGTRTQVYHRYRSPQPVENKEFTSQSHEVAFKIQFVPIFMSNFSLN